ncbi:hypothetical protein [Mesorhizobium sp. M0435]|uniref:hypothetical protein n=1 Tax=Mesorhizobium sp. M0435 TaxID=2956944 RepID=UPI00333C3667
MWKTMLRLVEAIVIRSGPGLLNLITLLLIGKWMPATDYGAYSTVVATSGLVSSVAFGPFAFAIVSQHAKITAEGKIKEYESSLVSLSALVSLVLAVLVSVPAYFGLVPWTFIAPFVAFGFYTTVQEILHARLSLWLYGTASLAQSIAYILLAWVIVRPNPTPSMALIAFSASYAVAAGISLLLSRPAISLLPRFSVVRETLRVGGTYTLSTIAEQCLYLGMRYLLLWFGTAQHLGIFSFSVDLAQRVVGFIINASSFITVPNAFKHASTGDTSEFRRTLMGGAALAALCSFVALAGIMAFYETGYFTALFSDLFSPLSFVIVSIAIMLNRTKKMAVDPIAINNRRPLSIALGYVLGIPIMIVSCAGLTGFGISLGFELSYFFAYCASTLMTLLLVRHQSWATGRICG